mmetsp:Transcript_14153/g.15670  ORF Transcript_14153/g.15670 Transcript_14153/m.15670 type:complete len:308 (+) Transcript_14153:69-992(+)
MKQLQQASLTALSNVLSDGLARQLHNYAQGIDHRKMHFKVERKSVSVDMTYGVRFSTHAKVIEFIKGVSDVVAGKLVASHNVGRLLTLKIKKRHPDAPKNTTFLGHGWCVDLSRSVTLNTHTDCGAVIGQHAINLYNDINVDISDLRGICLSMRSLKQQSTQPQEWSAQEFLVPSMTRHSNHKKVGKKRKRNENVPNSPLVQAQLTPKIFVPEEVDSVVCALGEYLRFSSVSDTTQELIWQYFLELTRSNDLERLVALLRLIGHGKKMKLGNNNHSSAWSPFLTSISADMQRYARKRYGSKLFVFGK